MRVLFWSEAFLPQIGGIEVLAAKLLPALQARGHEFIVVTALTSPDQPAQDEHQGIPVHRIPFALGHKNIEQLTKIRQRLIKLQRTFAPDLVHVNFAGVIGLFLLTATASLSALPWLFTVHDERLRDDQPDLPVGADTLIGRALRSAKWISCVSAAVRAEICRQLPEVTSRSSTIHNGLDTPPLIPAPLSLYTPRLLCLGRLVARKGFDVALSAFAAIVRRFPQARMIIAGDGPARPALEDQVVRLGLTDVVEFIGWVAPENVPALINTATIVVMPSRLEPFGLVALEAAQMARPIVATRVGGLSEVVEQGQTGFLVDNENVNQVAAAIATLLERPELAIRMGQAAHQRALERFGWDRCVDAYDTLYRKLVTEAQHQPVVI